MNTKTELQVVGNELIKVMDLYDKDENGDRVDISLPENEKELEKFIKTAMDQIDPVLDSFTKKTLKILKEYGCDISVLKEAPTEANTIEQEIENAETLKELKEIAQSEFQFKSIRGKLASFKDIDKLRKEMMWLFTDAKPTKVKEHELFLEKEETQEEVAERLHEKLEKKEIKKSKIEKVKEEVADEDENYPDDTELLGLGTMKTEDIVTIKPFNSLFSIDDKVFDAVLKDMEDNGYDYAFPIIVWGDVVIDGHTRLEAAEVCKIAEIPILRKEFKDEKEALEYAIHNQRDRRNVSDAELLRCIEAIDAPMTKKEAGAKGGASKSEVKKASEPVKSHKETAKKLGVGETKVTDARVVLVDEEARKEVESGKKTISKAAKEVREKKAVDKPAKAKPEKKKLPKTKKEFKKFLEDFLRIVVEFGDAIDIEGYLKEFEE
jgi:ParB family chromosome partitioning protein